MEEKENEGSAGVSQKTLCWTNNRTFQQIDNNNRRARMMNVISKVRKSPPFFCRQHSLVLFEYKDQVLQKVTKSRLRCKSWSCPHCAPINAVGAYFKIRDVVFLNNLTYFLTLTLDPQKIPDKYFDNGLNKTHKYITYLFNRFLTVIRRHHKDLKYVWVIQFHKNGNAHLHILLNVRLDITFVRSEWTRIGGGVQMKVEKVQSLERVCSYVANYISKGFAEISTGNIGFFYYEKRYMISHSCIRSKKTFQKLSDNSETYEKLQPLLKLAIISEDGRIYPKRV